MKRITTIVLIALLALCCILPVSAAPKGINLGDWFQDKSQWITAEPYMVDKIDVKNGTLTLPLGNGAYEDILVTCYAGEKVGEFSASFKLNMKQTQPCGEWWAFFVFAASKPERLWEATEDFYYLWITDNNVQLGSRVADIWYTDVTAPDTSLANREADFLVTLAYEGNNNRITVSVDGKEYINVLDDGSGGRAPIRKEGMLGFLNNPGIGGDVVITAGSQFLSTAGGSTGGSEAGTGSGSGSPKTGDFMLPLSLLTLVVGMPSGALLIRGKKRT